jgi:transcriptional antiterminator NusG
VTDQTSQTPEPEEFDAADAFELNDDLLDDAADEATEEVNDGREWYVVHCYSGMETRVKRNLEHRVESMSMENRIFAVVVPTEEQIELKDGERRVVERRVFPGYILVQMILDDDSWSVVRNTPGITGFVGIGNRPTPLSAAEVDHIMSRIEAGQPRVQVNFKVGDKVRITEGAFADFHGTVEEIDVERGKVRILVSIFGRETPVDVDFLQVEKS